MSIQMYIRFQKKKLFVSHAKLHVTYILYKEGEHTYIKKNPEMLLTVQYLAALVRPL